MASFNKAQLIGKDPFDIETHSSRLRYYAGGAAYRGTAGVDIALRSARQ